MASWWSQIREKLRSPGEGLHSHGADLERKFWPAMALYAILAVVAWFTLGEGSLVVQGRPVEIRLLPIFVFGMMAFRTVLARQADRIRRK
jgi:hypothetical protein